MVRAPQPETGAAGPGPAQSESPLARPGPTAGGGPGPGAAQSQPRACLGPSQQVRPARMEPQAIGPPPVGQPLPLALAAYPQAAAKLQEPRLKRPELPVIGRRDAQAHSDRGLL